MRKKGKGIRNYFTLVKMVVLLGVLVFSGLSFNYVQNFAQASPGGELSAALTYTYNDDGDGSYSVTGITGEKSDLVYVVIPETYDDGEYDEKYVVAIEDSAFSGCSNLESITLPSTITTIGEYVFEGCENLKIMVIKATTPPTLAGAFFKGVEPVSALESIYVPKVEGGPLIKQQKTGHHIQK